MLIGGINATSGATNHVYPQYDINPSNRSRDLNNLVKTSTNYIPVLRPWYQTCLAVNGSAFTEYISVSSAGAYSVAYATPTWNATGAIIAVSGAAVQLSSIQTEVTALGTIAGDVTGRGVVVSHTGAILASSNAAVTFKYVSGLPCSIAGGGSGMSAGTDDIGLYLGRGVLCWRCRDVSGGVDVGPASQRGCSGTGRVPR